MQCNVGKADRMLRIGAGVVLIGFWAVTGNWLGAIGIIPLATGLMRWCPAYTLIKFSTDKSEAKAE